MKASSGIYISKVNKTDTQNLCPQTNTAEIHDSER
jgi:hypothetical protein